MTNQEAIDLLDNLIGMIEDNHGSDYDSAIRMAIDALKQKWIPCSKKIPEIGDYVLCSQINGDVGEGKLLGDGSWVICYDQTCRGSYWVNAWQPLPESWKEEKDETNRCGCF